MSVQETALKAVRLFSEFIDDPRINARGAVAFRADLTAGGRAILIGDGGSLTTIADTSGGVFSDLFNVSIDRGETVAFHGALVAGGPRHRNID